MVVSNSAGSITSNPAILTVTQQPHNELSLDGVGDFAREPVGTSSPSVLDQARFTAEAWFFPTAFKTMAILSDSAYDVSLITNPGAANGGVGIRATLFYGATGRSSTVQFRDVSLNQWNHVSFSYDPSTNVCAVSINGKLSTSPDCVPATLALEFDLLFGVGTPSAGDRNGTGASTETLFQGRIDEIRISNIVRYSVDFTLPTSDFVVDGNTLALWHFDEPVGTQTFIDASGNGHSLTGLGNASTTVGTKP